MRYKYLFLILFTISLTGCCLKLSKFLNEPNSTSYIFNASLQDVKKAIKKGLNHKFYGMSLYFREDKYSWTFSDSLLFKSGYKDDAFLQTIGDPIKSRKYYNIYGRLYYDVTFHIHLDSINEQKTKVEIFTFNPLVVTGYRPGLGDNYSLLVACEKIVKPSTVEEYEILLIMGNILGEANMPKLRKPHILPFGD